MPMISELTVLRSCVGNWNVSHEYRNRLCKARATSSDCLSVTSVI